MLPPLTLVIGAAASGKSAWAEALLTGTGRPLVYLATARAHDDEMSDKIASHKARRGPEWRSIEVPMNPATALADTPEDHAVVLDCATLWLSNQMFAENDLEAEQTRLLAALAACPAPVVVVSNEVGAGIVPENALARRFRAAQGGLNQRLAAQADLVVTIIAGLPLCLKGRLA